MSATLILLFKNQCLVQAVDEEVGLAVVDEVDNQFAEEGVLPGEPGAGVARGIILVE